MRRIHIRSPERKPAKEGGAGIEDATSKVYERLGRWAVTAKRLRRQRCNMWALKAPTLFNA